MRLISSSCSMIILFMLSCGVSRERAIREASRMRSFGYINNVHDTCLSKPGYGLCYKNGMLDTGTRLLRHTTLVVAYKTDSLKHFMIFKRRKDGSLDYLWANYFPNLPW